MDYPNHYLNKIEKEFYPKNYIACFSKKFENDASHKKVTYETVRPEINFFKSLPRDATQGAKTFESWFKNDAGELSTKLKDFDRGSEAWHDEYLKNHSDIILTKTEDWAYEQA